MYNGLHVEYSSRLSDFNKTSTFSVDFLETPNMKFHKEPSNGSGAVSCGPTEVYDEDNVAPLQFCECA
jgi:hypothetical protein